jgi:hypothetical protein
VDFEYPLPYNEKVTPTMDVPILAVDESDFIAKK